MSKPQPGRFPKWVQGAVVGGLIGGVANFILCRCVQQLILIAAVLHGVAGPVPGDPELLGWALGVAALGMAIGGVAGASSTPLKGAGVGAAISIAIALLMAAPFVGGTMKPWIVPHLLVFASLFVVAAAVAGVFGGAVGQRTAEIAATEKVWQRIAAALGSAALFLALSLTTLFAWQELNRKPPDPTEQGDFLALSGDLNYILSEEHFQAIQMGMTLDEVETALDLAQARYDRGTMDERIGEGNVGLCRDTAQRLPASGEKWVHFQNPYGKDEFQGQQVSVLMKDGVVAEKRFHRGKFP